MDMAGLVVRLICALALVLGLLLLLARLAGRRFQGRAGAPVRLLHRQPISRGGSVSVVAVGTRILVLGSTEQQVTLLTELEPDEIDLPVGEESDWSESGSPAAVGPARRSPRTGGPRHARPTRRPSAADRPLAGSILSTQTWRQALAAATRAAGVPSDDSGRASDRQAS